MRKHHHYVYFYTIAFAMGAVGLYYLWRYAQNIMHLDGAGPLKWIIYGLMGLLGLLALSPMIGGIYGMGRESGEKLSKQESDELKVVIKKMIHELEHIIPQHQTYKDHQRIGLALKEHYHPTSDDWDNIYYELEGIEHKRLLHALDVVELPEHIDKLTSGALWWFENLEKHWTPEKIFLSDHLKSQLHKKTVKQFTRAVLSIKDPKALVAYLNSANPHILRLKLQAEDFKKIRNNHHRYVPTRYSSQTAPAR